MLQLQSRRLIVLKTYFTVLLNGRYALIRTRQIIDEPIAALDDVRRMLLFQMGTSECILNMKRRSIKLNTKCFIY